MATAFTGSLGWTGIHPVQLGGPPLVSTFARPLASKALPLLAHAYHNDGVTPAATATFGILNRPAIKAMFANGGYGQITLEPATKDASGNLVATTGPALGLVQGNVIRLTDLGGPYAGFVYGGVIESFPDALSPTGTRHEIVVSPFGWELTRVATQLLYTTSVDIVQAVRDAVALTQHCSCDSVSVPITTGIPLLSTTGATVDFRGQKVNQVLDTCRSIAGSTWYWYCDELGRVWFQPQGSAAVYTFMGGQHYEERITNGGDIQGRINQVPAIGGVPTGGSANVQATYNGSSQSTIGIRTLDPPIHLPGISDSATIQAIANGIGATLDQTWTRIQLKGLPPLGIPNEKHPGRVHGSQPGGAMVRYWEPGITPLPETGAKAGYTGPFICQSVTYDGLHQQIEAGSIPVTSQADIDNLVKSWAGRLSAIALNVPVPTLSGQTVMQTSTATSPGGRLSVADLTPRIRTDFGNLPAYTDPNGVTSPAEYGIRAMKADGSLIFDSVGIIPVMSTLVNQVASSQVLLSGISTIGAAATVSFTGSTAFTLARSLTVLAFCPVVATVTLSSGSIIYAAFLSIDGSDDFTNGLSSEQMWAASGGSTVQTNGLTMELRSLPAGSHAINLYVFVNAATAPVGEAFGLTTAQVFVFQLGN
jgi:hypothetical protein